MQQRFGRTLFRYLLWLFVATSLFGCKVHKTLNVKKPRVCIPEAFVQQKQEGTPYDNEWWKEFNSKELNRVMACAFQHNFLLKESYWRMKEFQALTRIANSGRYPEITAAFSVLHLRNSGNAASFGGIEVEGGGGGESGGVLLGAGAQSPVTYYLMSNALTYEVDLFRRIDSLVKAACFQYLASREDMEAVGWVISGAVTDLWFVILEQKTLLEVIDHQIEVSKTQLELIELRYSVADSSALDVYQQRLQLQQTIAQRPPVQTVLETAINQMNVLVGAPPGSLQLNLQEELADLPSFPRLRPPVSLICNRPDLRGEFRRLQAADYEVAAAVADLFPRLDISIFYEWRATSLKDLFDMEFSQIISRLMAPVFDGGRRRAEVARRKAVVCRLLQSYAQTFLLAVQEVEDALVEEKQQVDLLELLNKQLVIAKINLEEAQWHYMNGLNDYLTVIAAIQSLQNLERRIVQEKTRLLLFRSKLYRSLGGSYLTKLCCR